MSSEDSNFSRKVLFDLSVFVFDASKRLFHSAEK